MVKKQTPATERPKAPDTEPVMEQEEEVVEMVQPIPPPLPPEPLPVQKRIERQGVRSEPYTRRYPQIRGGVCEYCGVLDVNVPSEHQYKLCPHFRGIGEMRCSYCDEAKDPVEVVGHSILNIAESPDNPDTLIAWCNSYECSRKHEARFKRSR